MGWLPLHHRRQQTLCILFYFGGTPGYFGPKGARKNGGRRALWLWMERGGQHGDKRGREGRSEGLWSCPGWGQMEIRRVAGQTWRVPAVLVHRVLSVLRLVAEIQEATLIEYPKAKHRGGAGVRTVDHLLPAVAVAHHDIETAA